MATLPKVLISRADYQIGGGVALRLRTQGDLKPPIFSQAVKLFDDGMTVRQVAVALGISRSEAGRLRQKAEADGLLDRGRDDSGEHDTATEGHPRPN
jgi:hypothetical protein